MKRAFQQRRGAVAVVVCLFAASAALVGCASTPPPTDDLAVAAAAVERAERAGAERAAPGELNGARSKLSRARSLAGSDAAASARLAEQAEADAVLAEARAESLREREALASIERGLEALREEANRPAAAPPGPGAPVRAPGSTPTTTVPDMPASPRDDRGAPFEPATPAPRPPKEGE